jgi:hypothetical protein
MRVAAVSGAVEGSFMDDVRAEEANDRESDDVARSVSVIAAGDRGCLGVGGPSRSSMNSWAVEVQRCVS